MDRYKVRVTPFMFLLDESGIVRSKGLVNTRGGLDLYYKEYKEFKSGKRPGVDEEQEEEQGQEQEQEQSVAQVGSR